MKQLIKKILPDKVLHVALDMRDKRRLSAVPPCPFDATKLGESSAFLSPLPFFSDPATGDLWKVVHEEICGVFADDHIMGGINPGDRRALFYLIWALKSAKVLEIGTHIGASTLYIARALKYVADDAVVTTVDLLDVNDPLNGPWKQLGLPMTPAACADRLGCLEHIVFKASSALAFMANTDQKFDFIFLDGDHSADAVYREVSSALRLLNKGGVILLHDYYPGARPLFPDGNIISGPHRALVRITRENPLIEVRPLGALPWETKQGSHMTSLALVTKRLGSR
jgi:predicted O-methyltransferase YrrM